MEPDRGKDVTYLFGRENLPFNPLAKRGIREYYDRFYQRSEFNYYSVGITRRFLRAVLRKAGIRQHASILDVGCATGFYTEQFRSLGHNSVGLDISSVGVMKGRSKYPAVSFTVGDAANLPCKPGSFDAIFMFGCSLTNTRDMRSIRKFLSSLADYIRDDGAVIFVGGSNFSGRQSKRSEWIHHRYEEILEFVDRSIVDADGPYITSLRLVSLVGRMSLTQFFSSFILSLPIKKEWGVVYFIRKKKN